MIFKREKKISDTIIAYQKVFDSVEGRKVLFDLMKSCHILTPTFDGNPHEMSYKEGERSVILRILRTLETDPAKIMELVKQGNQEGEKYVD